MRTFLFILFSFITSVGISQENPVEWSPALKKLGGQTFEFCLKANIQGDWWLYADNNAEDITGLQVDFSDAGLQPTDRFFTKQKPVDIKDSVFNKLMKAYTNEVVWTQRVQLVNNTSLVIVKIDGFVSNGKEFLPLTETFRLQIPGTANVSPSNESLKLATVDLAKPVNNCGDAQNTDESLLTVFFLGCIGGLIALLTPCVFPMVPVTVSFFTGLGKTKAQGIKNGIFYGLSILFIYLLASVPFHLLGNINPQIFNTISTSAGVNIFFFAVFVFFALSFFGLFELKLPGTVATKADSKSGTGSFAGIFFMALTLAVVSFSCTGPILGSLLVGTLSPEGGAWQLTAGMGGFGLALALPFALFAMFPQWMRALPKSGGWLEVLKKSLAFIELALAIKFLSNADLVKHWGILKREVFIGLWILIALGLALYLFKAFERKRNSDYLLGDYIPVPKKSYGRSFFGIAALLFTIYLVPGVTNSSYANLKWLSGFPPPLSYSIYGKENIKGKGLEPAVINDYEKAIALAKQTGKPLLIDFTGWACVNCRKMEEQVWTNTEISELINDKFILLSLYVDDRKKLPAAEQFIFKTSEGPERHIKTLGDKWATFQAENFKQVTQPLYVVLSPDEKLMNLPVGYTPKAGKYKEWLECGLKAYLQGNN